jgi:hypothetical protein
MLGNTCVETGRLEVVWPHKVLLLIGENFDGNPLCFIGRLMLTLNGGLLLRMLTLLLMMMLLMLLM